jgi:hypothetical protein
MFDDVLDEASTPGPLKVMCSREDMLYDIALHEGIHILDHTETTSLRDEYDYDKDGNLQLIEKSELHAIATAMMYGRCPNLAFNSVLGEQDRITYEYANRTITRSFRRTMMQNPHLFTTAGKIDDNEFTRILAGLIISDDQPKANALIRQLAYVTYMQHVKR